MPHVKSINRVDGVLDMDSIGTEVKNGNIVDALNNFASMGGDIGTRQPYSGNIQVSFTLPSGTNTVVGAVEDKIGDTVIFFIRNTSSDHSILRYYRETAQIRLVDQGSHLGIEDLVHSGQCVDGRLLIYTDGYANRGTMTGSEPKVIDLDKAINDGKFLSYEIHYDEGSFQVLNQTYSLRVVTLSGTEIIPSTIFYTVNPVVDADTAWAAFGTALDAAGFSNVDVEICDNKIIVSSGVAERRIYLEQSTSDLHMVATNSYPETMIEDYVNLLRRGPKTGPAPLQVEDTNIKENKIWGNTFYFRYRYIYCDGVKSAFSPISYAPTNFVTYNDAGSTLTEFVRNDRAFTKINCHLDDDLLASEDWKSLIREVEIVVRLGEVGVWKSVGVFDVAEIGVSTHYIEFLNDRVYSVVASDENTTSDAQAFKNYDFVPRLVETMKLVSGSEGETRLSIGGMLEGWDMEPCLDMTVAAHYYDGKASTSVANQAVKNKSLKKGGVYNVGVVYEDQYGRQSAVVFGKQIRIPWIQSHDEDVGLDITFNSKPPEWATHFRIVISENQNQSKYVQLMTNRLEYWEILEDGTQKANQYTPPDSAITHVAFIFSLGRNEGEVNPLATMFDYTENDSNVFRVQNNDRIQICYENNVTGLSGEDLEEYNFRVAGYSVNSPGEDDREQYYVYVPWESNLDNANPGAGNLLVEIYRQKTASDQFYYEIPGRYEITDPGLDTRSHGSVSDIENIGDTFTGDQSFLVAVQITEAIEPTPQTVYAQHVERPNMHFHNDQIGSDWGRAVAEDSDFKQILEYNKIRLSDVYIPSTSVNGLSSFKGNEFIKINRELGYIKKMETLARVMLVICKFGCQPIYLGVDNVVNLSGDNIVGVSDKVLNLGNEMLDKWGTHHPEAVENTGKYIYFFDSYRGAICRYNSSNGIFPISNNGLYKELKTRLNNATLLERGILEARAGYDPRRGLVLFYLNDADRNDLTYTFSEEKGGFDGKVSLYPEYFSRIGVQLISFDGGQMWIHDHASSVNCNYFGTQYDCTVTIALNDNPTAVKIPHSIRVRSNEQWWMPLAEVLPNSSFAEGMQTRIKAINWEKYEGDWVADFMRDMNDTEEGFLDIVDPTIREATALLKGRHIRGDVIYITLQLNDPTKNGKLETIEVDYSLSHNSY